MKERGKYNTTNFFNNVVWINYEASEFIEKKTFNCEFEKSQKIICFWAPYNLRLFSLNLIAGGFRFASKNDFNIFFKK